MCPREWMTLYAASWVRGPRWRTGSSFVVGSMTSQSQSTVWRNGVGCAARLTAGMGGGGGRRTAHAEFVRAQAARESQVVMVACR
jgi:hypothetical protein